MISLYQTIKQVKQQTIVDKVDRLGVGNVGPSIVNALGPHADNVGFGWVEVGELGDR